MFLMPVDMPNTPQQVIERDVSVFLAASSKFPNIKDLPQMISTNKIIIGSFEGAYAHIAYYQKGGAIKKEPRVVTIINDQNGLFQSGTQIILYGNDAVRKSNTWRFEDVNGVRYVKHIHDDFYVYSTDYEQHIIKR